MWRGPRNLRIMFDAEALTHYGGAVLLYQFFQRIGIRTLLYRSVRFPQRNNRYRISETLLALLYRSSWGWDGWKLPNRSNAMAYSST